MAPTADFRVEPDGVAVITLNHPPVNALHPQVLRALFDGLRQAHVRPDVKAIVITGANGKFSAGFDINQFVSQAGGGGIDDTINQQFCELLEHGPKPSVAAVEGIALGGGCEVAMACNARIAASGSRLGLPELSLGILPGFGGTQRLPRLVGLQQAIQMMLTSKPVNDKQALKSGLVDAVVPAPELLAAARKFALEIAAGRRPRLFSLDRTDHLPPLGEALQVLEFARGETRKRARHLTHPLLCLDATQAGVEQGGLAGLQKEGEAFAQAASLDTHKALVHIFFAQRSTKKLRGITDAGLKPRRLQKVAILGGGLMGSGIATACALAGMEVIIKEVNETFLKGGLDRVRSNLASSVKKGRMTQAAADAVMARVSGTLDYSAFGSIDIVIEAVIEDIGLKQRIFADLERACRPDCILSTNTSTIDISVIGAKTHAAERIIGAHFFSPAHVMPLLEIVRTDKTSKQVICDLLGLSDRIKKTPVVVGNCTGFAVNRVFFPYTQAACLLLDAGLDPYLIDKAIALEFGMPMGPFRLSDLVGADIGLHVGKNFLDSFPDRVYSTAIFPLLNERKMLGEKTGGGFYKFDARRRASPNPDVKPLIEASRGASPLAKLGAAPPKMSAQDVIEFIFFPVVNEGCRVVEEGIVEKPSDLDVASVMAMGFPPYRGGLIKWADLVGPARIVARLEEWSRMFAGAGIANFFQPCEYLKRAASNGTQLSAGVAAMSRL